MTIESLGLPQGNPVSEIFRLDGSPKTTIYQDHGFWQRQETSAHWSGNDFVGTVIAKAGWLKDGPAETVNMAIPHTICTRTLQLGKDGTTLAIATSWYSPENPGSMRKPSTDSSEMRRSARSIG